jgi:hypothetical protein
MTRGAMMIAAICNLNTDSPPDRSNLNSAASGAPGPIGECNLNFQVTDQQPKRHATFLAGSRLASHRATSWHEPHVAPSARKACDSSSCRLLVLRCTPRACFVSDFAYGPLFGVQSSIADIQVLFAPIRQQSAQLFVEPQSEADGLLRLPIIFENSRGTTH